MKRHILMDAFRNREVSGGPGSSGMGFGQGQAALLLVESLMHSLVEKGLLSREDFIDVVEAASEVEDELGAANAPVPSSRDGSFLSPLANAFKIELGQ
jgi:hypothetical protein